MKQVNERGVQQKQTEASLKTAGQQDKRRQRDTEGTLGPSVSGWDIKGGNKDMGLCGADTSFRADVSDQW